MKSKSLQTYLFSGAGVLAVLLALVAVNFLAAQFKQRIDLTQEKAYTLSPGTREILSQIDTPVQIRLYVSGDNALPVFLKTYAAHVEDLLAEYRQASRGLVEVQVLNPEPDSDAEDSARLDGVDGQFLPNGDRVYLGLSVSMLDKKQAIPFLAPTRERLLEYEITRAISQVASETRPVVGLMSPLQLAGQMNPFMAQMGGARPAWALYNELKASFTVQDVPMSATEIPAEVSVLLLIHPKNLTEQTQYAIDQFLLRGGKLVAFLDPSSPFDGGNPMAGAPVGSSLDRLLPAWGLDFNPNKVVADAVHFGETRQGRQPAILMLGEASLDRDDVVTADADNVVLVFSGAFEGKPVEGLTESVLIRSSKDSELIDAQLVQTGGESILRNLKPSGKEFALAIRLTGKFPTAFPAGRPAPPPADPSEPEPPKEENAAPGLKEAAVESSVILFGDSDFLQDPVAVQELATPFGQRLLMPANGNLSIALAAVENLAGDSRLISVRSRASRERPFTVVRDLQARAEAAYREKISQLENSLQETEQRLTELQQGRTANQQFILSPEQQKELENFRKKEVEVRKELKHVRRTLRSEIDALETRLKWINIAAMPVLVALAGLGLALWRRKHSAAR